VNDPPHVIDPHLVIEMDEDTELILDLNTIFGDIDGDPLLYSVRPSDNISFDVSENTLSIVPNPNWSGSEYIHVEAFDGQYRINGSFLLIVNNVNDPPYDLVVEYNESYAEGSPQIARASAKDPDLPYGDTLNFTWKADGVAIGYGPEIDLGLPPGSYLINVTVRDGSGQSIHHEFEIEVTSQSNGKELPYLALILIALFIILAAIGILIFMRRSKTDPDPGVDLSDRDDMTNEGMNGDPPVLEEDGSKDLTEDEALPVPESTIPEEAPETSEQVPEVMPMEDVSPELIEPYDDHTPP
ncbi:MAG: Ig-like domain-containing protein, partial [Candidatus Thermoplasmatota archaeon]|nr:Ig-like domain-containing protein [Candidatus Thermoplasmatota archaeon]